MISYEMYKYYTNVITLEIYYIKATINLMNIYILINHIQLLKTKINIKILIQKILKMFQKKFF